ncbi:glycosyltransferase 87 family protein [Streptomyces sp. AV19]|uniref:glycosyltransferase 87 family protein n=1 Tax=Streptomyces sp. AV19 TaxID=2793068 RepID=UPI001F3EF73A|nr:glycosyltransferase 87 family protein [Streptomyces sp. AV19]MDG4531412.1 glycosyltransferase 87 family protein [Streptomyces sp. AV19]
MSPMRRAAGKARTPEGAGGDGLARWARGRASWPLLAAALLVYLLSAGRMLGVRRTGMDNAVVVRAARHLLDGGSPYADKRFLYLPGAVFAALPQAPFSDRTLTRAVPFVTAAFVLAGVVLALRIFDVRADSRLAAAVTAGLALFLPFQGIVHLGNWTAASVVAFPAALLLALRGRWSAAGAVVGAAIALKPMLVPLLLLFVLARRWRALAWAVALPSVISSAAALAMPRPQLFLTKTLPFLLHGQDDYAAPYDASWTAVLPRLGVPHHLAFALGACAAVAALCFARARWRAGGDEALRLVECGSLLMLAAFLVSRPSFLHYALVILPALVASVVVRGAAARQVWFWMPLVPQIAGVPWPELGGSRRHAFKDIVMFTGAAAVLALAVWRRRATTARTVTVSGAPYSLGSDPEPRSPSETR